MPKSDSAQTLLKRLEKIERAQSRLGEIRTRILAQADALAELLKVAQAFAGQSAPPKPPAGTARKRATSTAKKASSAKRATRKAPSAPRAAPAKAAAARRRAPAKARTAAATTRGRPRRTRSSA
jgi:hypothetical protein